MQRFWETTSAVEWEILGVTVEGRTEQLVEKVKAAAQPEKIQAFLASRKKAPPAQLEDILIGAACGATKDEIKDDAWIDGIIDEIRENFRGVPMLDEDDILPFAP
jgi:hypothetical protein